MKIKFYLIRALTLPPHILAKKIIDKARQIFLKNFNRLRDWNRTTYPEKLIDGSLYRYLSDINAARLQQPLPSELREELSFRYLQHRFNLLGSGWVQVKYGMHCKGLDGFHYARSDEVAVDQRGEWLDGRINKANVVQSQRIWQLIDADYIPIDWQMDFKSGFRWKEKNWYQDIVYAHQSGVDVKVPWELSRMQHLPQLAWFYGLNKASTYNCLREFRNQILDFIATNPPRFGVNWVCTMDVGIRVVNWLVAYDLFNAYGAEFDDDFERVFKQSLYAHAAHIIYNLEWSEELTSNHYLANIVGLLFISAYLPQNSEVDAWLAFSVQELINEVEKQFHAEGSNFEASTSYHRLSAEMVAYATALVLGLPEEKKQVLTRNDRDGIKTLARLTKASMPMYPVPGSQITTFFPDWYFKRLFKMARFTTAITKLNRKIVQIGDNDSGRFLKLHPVFNQVPSSKKEGVLNGFYEIKTSLLASVNLQEDFLNHAHLISAINGLFDYQDFSKYTENYNTDAVIIKLLAKNKTIPTDLIIQSNTKNIFQYDKSTLKGIPEVAERLIIDLPGDNLIQDMELLAYQDFGLYIFKSTRLFLSVRCGPIGQNGRGGHAHNDQLSIELNVDGKDYITDPGTYVYTPLPDQRQLYRSATAHFVPQITGIEPGNLNHGFWRLGDEAKAQCHYFNETIFQGSHEGYGVRVWRQVEIKAQQIIITDWSENTSELRSINDQYRSLNPKGALIDFCQGYGMLDA